MTRAKPEWLSRIIAMRPEEVIVVQTDLAYQTVNYHLRQTPGRFRAKVRPQGFKIERVE